MSLEFSKHILLIGIGENHVIVGEFNNIGGCPHQRSIPTEADAPFIEGKHLNIRTAEFEGFCSIPITLVYNDRVGMKIHLFTHGMIDLVHCCDKQLKGHSCSFRQTRVLRAAHFSKSFYFVAVRLQYTVICLRDGGIVLASVDKGQNKTRHPMKPCHPKYLIAPRTAYWQKAQALSSSPICSVLR